jgi:archaellum component FlaC
MAFGMFLSNKKVVQCESKKTQDTTSSPQSSANPMNPIENVNMLLRLYEQIDQNMEILGERMLKELQEKIEEVSYVFLLILY